MKYIISVFLVVFLFVENSSAQKTELVGEWLATRVEINGEVQEPYMVQEFTADGKMIIMGMEAGTWVYNKSSKTIEMKSELDKDFNGTSKILKLKAGELVVLKDDTKVFYIKVEAGKIAAENKKSGLEGSWKINDTSISKYIKFELPDLFTLVEKGDGMSSTAKGTWMFNAKDKTLLTTGRSDLRGKNTIVEKSPEKIVLQNGNNSFTLLKESSPKGSKTGEIERLTFTEDDFYNEDGDYKYYDDEEKLPWWNWAEIKTNLLNVSQLVYKYSALVEGTEAFETKTLTADVKATLEEEGFTVDNVFLGFDRYNLPEDSAFPENSEFSQSLYPLTDAVFRVAGNEQITTPAGTFGCIVLEAIGDSGELKKLWVITDKLGFGIYAKIIDENPDETWGHYHTYQLQEIK